MKTSDLTHFGERISAERKRLGLSQAEAAKRCDVSQVMWGRYERGLFEIGLLPLLAFVDAGADIDFITTGIPKAEFERVIATTTPPHMKGGSEGREAALLRHYRSLQEPLQGAVSELVETMANVHVMGKGGTR